MREPFKERKLFKGGNYMWKYGMWKPSNLNDFSGVMPKNHDLSLAMNALIFSARDQHDA